MPSDSVLIVGGGISGLATAFYLGRAGIRSTIIEKSNRLGGLIKTDRVEGCELEAGPDSFISTKTAVAELADDLGGGLPEKIIGSNDAARRIFVVRGGKLVPMPKGMAMMVPGQWAPLLRSPLLGLSTKLILLRETAMRPRVRAADFSVGELVSQHFGPEMLHYVTDPLLGGVYGGDAASLSARSVLPRFVALEERYGSLIRGVRATTPKTAPAASLFQSFDGGMQTLVSALSKAIQPHANVICREACKVEKTDSGWRVRFANESTSARHLVLTCPAWATAQLLRQEQPALAAELFSIQYSSAILATLVFDQAELGHHLDGFGFLVPQQERRTIAAATWINTKFPSRIPKGLVALRAFIVAREAELLLQSSNEEVLIAVRDDFQRIMGIQAVPRFHTIQAWPNAMPQYVVGHEARIQRIAASARNHPGLALTGNYFDGVGIPDCVRRAKQAAKHIVDGNV